jgi:hypothetical protein
MVSPSALKYVNYVFCQGGHFGGRGGVVAGEKLVL